MPINGAINIINGFSVGAPYPIDYRMVMNNASERLAIVHKYDGLRVFQTDTRETFIWNEGTTNWEPDSVGIGGGGSASYIPVWNNSQNLGNSNLYNTGNRIGLNTESPEGSFHIRQFGGSTASSMILDVPTSDLSFIGFRSRLSGSSLISLDSIRGSMGIRFTSFSNQSSMEFLHRRPNAGVGTFEQKFELGYLNSLNQYCNVLNGTGARNYIVGSASITPSLSAPFYTDNNQDLLMVNGSFRTNGRYSKQVTTMYYQYNINYIMRMHNFRNTTSNFTNTNVDYTTPIFGLDPVNGTYQLGEEHELIIYNQTINPNLKKVTINLPQNQITGREINIDYISGGTHSTITSSDIMRGLNGNIISPINLNPGERIKIVLFRPGEWQVTELIADNQIIKNNITNLESTLKSGAMNRVLAGNGVGSNPTYKAVWEDFIVVGSGGGAPSFVSPFGAGTTPSSSILRFRRSLLLNLIEISGRAVRVLGSGNIVNGNPVFILPLGYRPSRAVWGTARNSNGNNVLSLIIDSTTGEVIVLNKTGQPSPGTNDWIDISLVFGIS